MRVLWLSHLVPYPPRSGVAQRSYGLLNELCKRHEVTLMAFHQSALMRSMSHDPAEALEIAERHLTSLCSRVRLFRIPWEKTRLHRNFLAASSLIRSRPYTINWLESAEFARALNEERSRHDLVHFDTISLALYRDHFDEVPCVMNHHNIESHLLHRRARKTGSVLARAYYRQEAARLETYERKTAGRFRLHVVCSELDRQRLLEVSPGLRCCVVPNGVDVGYFEKRPGKPPSPTFTFIGTLGWGPNRDAVESLVAELWPAIVSEWPHAKMYVVGSNPPRSATDLAGRDERFVVTGFADDVRPYMRESSFFLCPIRDGGGTKLKILNAMAMGMVVLADPIAYEGIEVSPGSDAVLAEAPDDYVRAVREMLADPARYADVADAAHRLIETRYAYEVIGRDLDRRYRSVVEAPGPY